MIRPPPTSTLFPYTTLFRSQRPGDVLAHQRRGILAPRRQRGQHLRRARRVAECHGDVAQPAHVADAVDGDRKSTRLNSSHMSISYAVFCLKKKKKLTRASRH